MKGKRINVKILLGPTHNHIFHGMSSDGQYLKTQMQEQSITGEQSFTGAETFGASGRKIKRIWAKDIVFGESRTNFLHIVETIEYLKLAGNFLKIQIVIINQNWA